MALSMSSGMGIFKFLFITGYGSKNKKNIYIHVQGVFDYNISFLS
jgi:hypothetical protein